MLETDHKDEGSSESSSECLDQGKEAWDGKNSCQDSHRAVTGGCLVFSGVFIRMDGKSQIMA